jgi:chemotaxis protein methyltransferase CheR
MPEDVDDLEVRLLLEAIHAKYGYDLREYAMPSMRRRVMAALARSGLPHLGEMQHRVLHDPEFFATVLDGLTVRVSEMFRDPPFYRAFRARVIPLLRTYPLLKLWHAGCATGDEVYTTAIVLLEENLYARSQIYGTDLSAQALEHAKAGVYTSEAMRKNDRNYAAADGRKTLASYYTEAYGQAAFPEYLRKNVLFFQHNLASDHVFGEMHVIFCRNVLIYFDPALRRRILDTFAQSLCPGGFLCLGSSERISDRADFTAFDVEQRIYRRAA